MRNIIITLILSLLMGLYGIKKLEIHPIIPSPDFFTVTIKVNDEIHELNIPAYSTLKEVLEKIDLPENVDYDRINPNQILNHQDVYVIPIKKNRPCIHLNHADETELMMLKGVGPSIAQRIIEFREEYGLFQHIEEIMQVKGIGEKTFEKMKDDLCL